MEFRKGARGEVGIGLGHGDGEVRVRGDR
jgi:hypothetical protein